MADARYFHDDQGDQAGRNEYLTAELRSLGDMLHDRRLRDAVESAADEIVRLRVQVVQLRVDIEDLRALRCPYCERELREAEARQGHQPGWDS